MKIVSTRDERGFAVPLALLILVVLGLVGGAAAYMSAGDTATAGLYAGANRVSDAASAGLEHAVGKYRVRMIDYEEADGDLGEWIENMGWPVEDTIEEFDYSVTAVRDSFDFDGDGDEEPVSCKPTGNGNKGNNGNNGNGSGDGGDTGDEDNGDYWKDEGEDKDGDGELGLGGGHFDVDVWDGTQDRKYHQHEFDDKYDTNQADLVQDPNLLWDDLLKSQNGDVRIEFFNEGNASGTWELDVASVGEISGEIGDGTTVTVEAKKMKMFRIRFSNLMTFSCTDPGSVDKDPVDRDEAYHLRIYDEASGDLVYEWGAYWHAKDDECEEKKEEMEDGGDDDGDGGDDGDGNNGNGNGNNGNGNGNGNKGNSGPTCSINGNGDGDPVYVLTSTATRGTHRATERLRVSSDHDSDDLIRLSWLADN